MAVEMAEAASAAESGGGGRAWSALCGGVLALALCAFALVWGGLVERRPLAPQTVLSAWAEWLLAQAGSLGEGVAAVRAGSAASGVGAGNRLLYLQGSTTLATLALGLLLWLAGGLALALLEAGGLWWWLGLCLSLALSLFYLEWLFLSAEPHYRPIRRAHFDERNLLLTHPPDAREIPKDLFDPPTPRWTVEASGSEESNPGKAVHLPKDAQPVHIPTAEERRRAFEKKRDEHYNMQALFVAKHREEAEKAEAERIKRAMERPAPPQPTTQGSSPQPPPQPQRRSPSSDPPESPTPQSSNEDAERKKAGASPSSSGSKEKPRVSWKGLEPEDGKKPPEASASSAAAPKLSREEFEKKRSAFYAARDAEMAAAMAADAKEAAKRRDLAEGRSRSGEEEMSTSASASNSELRHARLTRLQRERSEAEMGRRLAAEKESSSYPGDGADLLAVSHKILSQHFLGKAKAESLFPPDGSPFLLLRYLRLQIRLAADTADVLHHFLRAKARL